MEVWLARYPAEDRASLIARLRSADDDVHRSALFELTMHELLICNGCKILAIEPAIDGTSKTPDFLAETPKGEKFYLEAVLATGRSRAEGGRQRVLSEAMRTVESVRSPAHFLDVKVDGKPSAPPSLKKLRASLQAWVDSLPPGEEVNRIEPFCWSEHGLAMTITAFRRKKPAGRDDPRSVGMLWGQPYVGTPGDGLREVISKKARRYGKLDAPYVVAVNALQEYQNEDDAIAALFGSPCVIIRTHSDGTMEHFDSRNKDGVWYGNRGPRKKGLSAVVSFDRLGAWNVARQRGRMILNPWADRSLPPLDLQLDVFTPGEGELVKSEGTPLHVIFDLPEEWPEAN